MTTLIPSRPGERQAGRAVTACDRVRERIPQMLAAWGRRKKVDLTIPTAVRAVVDGQVPDVSTENPALVNVAWRERSGIDTRRTYTRNNGTFIITLYHYHDHTSDDPYIAHDWLVSGQEAIAEEMKRTQSILRLHHVRVSSGVPGLSTQNHVMTARLEVDAVVYG